MASLHFMPHSEHSYISVVTGDRQSIVLTVITVSAQNFAPLHMHNKNKRRNLRVLIFLRRLYKLLDRPRANFAFLLKKVRRDPDQNTVLTVHL